MGNRNAGAFAFRGQFSLPPARPGLPRKGSLADSCVRQYLNSGVFFVFLLCTCNYQNNKQEPFAANGAHALSGVSNTKPKALRRTLRLIGKRMPEACEIYSPPGWAGGQLEFGPRFSCTRRSLRYTLTFKFFVFLFGVCNYQTNKQEPFAANGAHALSGCQTPNPKLCAAPCACFASVCRRLVRLLSP